MADQVSHKINLLIVTPYESFFEGMVNSVSIPTVDGEFGFMAGHSPFVAAIEPGTCTLRINNEVKHCMLSEGYCEVSGMLALIVCNSAEWPENLRIRRMVESYKAAIEELKTHKNEAGQQVFPEDSIAKGKRALARIRFIEKYGSEQQKERIASLKKSEFPNGVLPRLQ